MTTQNPAQVVLILSDHEECSIDHLPFYIGRRAKSDLVLDDPRVSNTHCVLEVNLLNHRPVLQIRDLRSRNGTMVQRQQKEFIVNRAPVALHEGDLILLGDRGGDVKLKVASISLATVPTSNTLMNTQPIQELEQALENPTLLVEAVPPVAQQKESSLDPWPILFKLALKLSSTLESKEIIQSALQSFLKTVSRTTQLVYHPRLTESSGSNKLSEQAIRPNDLISDDFPVDLEQAQITLMLGKLTPFHTHEEHEGFIAPVIYKDSRLGVVIITCAHPPLSGKERHLLKQTCLLLAARLHSAYYYQALKSSAEELVVRYEALQQAYTKVLHQNEQLK